MRETLKRVLQTKPEFIRLINAAFAVLVGFQAIDVTAEQFGLVVVGIEALFGYVSNLAFKRDVAELQAARADNLEH